MNNDAQAPQRHVAGQTGASRILRSPCQTFATVLVVSDEWELVGVSANCETTIGWPASALLGRDLSEIIDNDSLHDLRSQSQILSPDMPILYLRHCRFLDKPGKLDATVTRSGSYLMVELEAAAVTEVPPLSAQHVQRVFRRIAAHDQLEKVLLEASRTIRALCGFDRVSVHRIGPSGFGPALAFVGNAPLRNAPDDAILRAYGVQFSPNLHLIPDIRSAAPQDMFLKSLDGEVPRFDPRGLCTASLGPHLSEALDRGQVRGAMSVPIRLRGELWGVILCHHAKPTAPAVNLRSDLTALSHMLGILIERCGEVGGLELRTRLRDARTNLLARAAVEGTLSKTICTEQKAIMRTLPHDGLAVWSDGTYLSEGHALSRDDFERVFERLVKDPGEDIFFADKLSESGLRVRSVDGNRTSLIAMSLTDAAKDVVVLTRRFGGAEQVASTWRPWEIEAAQTLRSIFVETRAKLIDSVGVKMRQTQEQQGLLIAELNHRVRNTLFLIQGLVTQTKGSATDVDSYADILEDRIQSLARAYNDVTTRGWTWIGVQELLARERDEVSGPHIEQIELVGDDFLLSPSAYAVMSLVINELRRNAEKFGALSEKTGRVSICTSIAQDGFGEIIWTENGGPPVAQPKHRGFGRRVLEEAVKHELRGASEVTFGTEGVLARMRLPPGHIRRPRGDPDAKPLTKSGGKQEQRNALIQIDGVALVVEDSLIVSMEADHLLRSSGATAVRSCNSVDSAFEALDSGEITFALLDVNLGGETSLAVAEQVWNDGIPAALATGYGADEDVLADYPPLPVLTKPYTLHDIQNVLWAFRKTD